jgi:hypothetical protein
LITTLGELHIKRYLGRQATSIAESIAYGLDPTAESVGDKTLGFEVGREDTTLTTFNHSTNNVIFKTSLPTEWAGTVYEIGLWSVGVDSLAGNYGSRLISHFDTTEGWSATTYSTANSRVGIDALRLSPATSATATATRSNLTLDLSGYSSADTFKLAYATNNAFTSNVSIRLYTDASNYYTLSASPGATPGYKFSSFTKASAVATGTPTWSSITSIEARATSTGGGGAVVDFDALRLDDSDPYNPDYVLVAREVLASPIVKVAGRPMEIEFALGVSIT